MSSPSETSQKTNPQWKLRFLYVGSRRFDDDVKYYRDSISAEQVWNFKAFGARVAAFHLGEGPLLLLADHRPAPSCIPVFEVKDLKITISELGAKGVRPDRGPFEIPNGPCCMFKDPSGNEFAIFQDERPNVLEEAYSDPRNKRVVREES